LPTELCAALSGVVDPPVVKRCAEREDGAGAHAGEIREAAGYVDLAARRQAHQRCTSVTYRPIVGG